MSAKTHTTRGVNYHNQTETKSEQDHHNEQLSDYHTIFHQSSNETTNGLTLSMSSSSSTTIATAAPATNSAPLTSRCRSLSRSSSLSSNHEHPGSLHDESNNPLDCDGHDCDTSSSASGSSMSTSASPSSFCSSSFDSSVSSSQVHSASPNDYSSSNSSSNNNNNNNYGSHSKLSLNHSCLPTAEVPGAVVTTQNASTVIRPGPKGNYDPLQFVKIHTAELSKKAVEQIKLAEEVKITKDKIKEVEEEWQNNLMSWKSKRRQQMSVCNLSSDGVVNGHDESIDVKGKRKIKTFAEMLEDRARAGARIGYNLQPYLDDDDKSVCHHREKEDNETSPSIEQRMDAMLLSNSEQTDETDFSQNDTDNNYYNGSAMGGTVMGVHFSDPMRYKLDTNLPIAQTNSSDKTIPANNGSEQDNNSEGTHQPNRDNASLRRERYGRSMANNYHNINNKNHNKSVFSNEDADSSYQSDALSSSPQNSTNNIRQPDTIDSNDEDDDADAEEAEARHRQRKAFIEKLKAFENLSSTSLSESSHITPKQVATTRDRRISQPLNNQSPNNQVSLRPSRSELRIDCRNLNSQNLATSQTSSESMGSLGRSLSMPRNRINNLGSSEEYKKMHNIRANVQSKTNSIVLPNQEEATKQLVHVKDTGWPKNTIKHDVNCIPKKGLLIECTDVISNGSDANRSSNLLISTKDEPMRVQIISPNSTPAAKNSLTTTAISVNSTPKSPHDHIQYARDVLPPPPPPPLYRNDMPQQVQPQKCVEVESKQITTNYPEHITSRVYVSTTTLGSATKHLLPPTYPMYQNQQSDMPLELNYEAAALQQRAILTSSAIISRSSASVTHYDNNNEYNNKPPTLFSSYDMCGQQSIARPHHQTSSQSISGQTIGPFGAPSTSLFNAPNAPHNTMPPDMGLNADMQNNKTILSISGRKRCSSCNDELGRGCAAMVIESLRLYYHINCFRCSVCHVQLSNGFCGTDVRVHAGALHCQNCYSKDGLNFSRV